MTKTILTFAIALAALTASAATPVPTPTDEALTLTCITEYPTTSFIVEPTDDGKMIGVRIFHHNGVDYMPIHEGVVVTNDLSILSGRAKELVTLGTDYSFKFPRENAK